MAVTTRYRADEPADGKRYVRYAGAGRYVWCETGECAVDDLPPGVTMAAIERAGNFPPYVDWPL